MSTLAPAARQAVTCIVSPNAADAELTVSLLHENGIAARAFARLTELAPTLDEESACLVLVEDALLEEDLPVLRAAFERLPAWCDVPLVLVGRDVASLAGVVAQAFPASGNVTLLGRPLNVPTLVSAVQMALRATVRQRQVGELIAQREQAVRLRDEFLAMLAHELRNPLAPMRNALYLMRLQNIADPAVRKSTEILERQVGHVVRMVDDLMDVARLERGKVTLKRQRVDLNRVVASAAESCVQTAQERGHHISVHFGAKALPVDADVVRMEQIVSNLVNNAAKFTPRPDEIHVQTSVDGGFALVAVEDRGIGFEQEASEYIFDPFLQVNPTLERTAGGLGMGLTIVRRLAELHGGSVHAASAGPGRGARFIVRIPLADGMAAPAAAPELAAAAARPRRVVVVEDNPDIRETVRMMLTFWGHQVTLASDGHSGVEAVLRERPDVALVDVGLPGLNGYDVARSIRKFMPNGEIRLIAITGYGQPSDRDLALAAGFDMHLLKPITPEVLQKVLAE